MIGALANQLGSKDIMSAVSVAGVMFIQTSEAACWWKKSHSGGKLGADLEMAQQF